MEGWMIGILIIGAIIAIAFIVRNKKNPVGGSKKQQQQDYLNEEQQRHCNKYKKYYGTPLGGVFSQVLVNV